MMVWGFIDGYFTHAFPSQIEAVKELQAFDAAVTTLVHVTARYGFWSGFALASCIHTTLRFLPRLRAWLRTLVMSRNAHATALAQWVLPFAIGVTANYVVQAIISDPLGFATLPTWDAVTALVNRVWWHAAWLGFTLASCLHAALILWPHLQEWWLKRSHDHA